MAAPRIAETRPFTHNSRMTRRARLLFCCLTTSALLLAFAVAPLRGQAAADPREPTTLPAVEPPPQDEVSTTGPATTEPAQATTTAPAGPTPPTADQPYSLAELADRAESTAVVVRRV